MHNKVDTIVEFFFLKISFVIAILIWDQAFKQRIVEAKTAKLFTSLTVPEKSNKIPVTFVHQCDNL